MGRTPSERRHGGVAGAGERASSPMATICDHVRLPEVPAEGRMMMIVLVDHPILLIPFPAAIAKRVAMTLHLNWEGGAPAHGGTAAWPRRAAGILGAAVASRSA